MEHARPPSELSLDGSPVSRADAWRRWKTQFLLFLKASGVHKEEPEVQSSLLINLIGSDGFDVYQTLSFGKETDRDNVNIVLQKFDEYFGTKPNITLARYNFFTRDQEDGETISQYVVSLKLLSKHCEFASLEEELIRDRVVCGIRSGVVRDRLLREDTLTLTKAIKICEADEVSSDGSRRLEARTGSGAGPARVDALRARGARGARGAGGGRRGRGRPWPGPGPHGGAGAARPGSSRPPCHGCGMQCLPGTCPAINVKCFVCLNYGHYARMCNTPRSVKKMYEIGVREDNTDNDEEDRFTLTPTPTVEHFIMPPSYCLLADLCNHSWVPECGSDYADPKDLRTFRDECDMLEYNCDHDREFEVTNYSDCFKPATGCPKCPEHKCDDVTTTMKVRGKTTKATAKSNKKKTKKMSTTVKSTTENPHRRRRVYRRHGPMPRPQLLRKSKAIQRHRHRTSPPAKLPESTVVLKRETIFREGVKLIKVVKGVVYGSGINKVITGNKRGTRSVNKGLRVSGKPKSTPASEVLRREKVYIGGRVRWRVVKRIAGATAAASAAAPTRRSRRREIDLDSDFLE